jgi:hypothetical protein
MIPVVICHGTCLECAISEPYGKCFVFEIR